MAGDALKSITPPAVPNPPGPGAAHLTLPRARSMAGVVRSIVCRRVPGTALASQPLGEGRDGAMAEVLTAPRVMTGDETVADGAVVIGDRTVDWAGPAAALPAEYAERPRTHYPDATIMPGLIDSHVHLGFDGGPKPAARLRT